MRRPPMDEDDVELRSVQILSACRQPAQIEAIYEAAGEDVRTKFTVYNLCRKGLLMSHGRRGARASYQTTTAGLDYLGEVRHWPDPIPPHWQNAPAWRAAA